MASAKRLKAEKDSDVLEKELARLQPDNESKGGRDSVNPDIDAATHQLDQKCQTDQDANSSNVSTQTLTGIGMVNASTNTTHVTPAALADMDTDTDENDSNITFERDVVPAAEEVAKKLRLIDPGNKALLHFTQSLALWKQGKREARSEQEDGTSLAFTHWLSPSTRRKIDLFGLQILWSP